MLSRVLRWSVRAFRGPALRLSQENPRLRIGLQRANINLLPEAYMAATLLSMTVAFGLLLIPLIAALVLLAGTSGSGDALLLITIPGPVLAPLLILAGSFLLPDMRARARSRDIDAKLPYALNFIATMASAGATPERLFESLAGQRVYGEVAVEAARIRRDMQLLGKDAVGALSAAADRSPSIRFQDLLQGAITSMTSGGDLVTFFRNKADQYVLENRQSQKGFLESLGVLAESFVTVVVAAPLFLLIILSVMTSFGADDRQMLKIGYLLILVLLPLAQAGFAFTIKTMTPEA